MKDRIRNLLINGLQASEVATFVGCSPSYISQLLKDQEFADSVQAGKLAISSTDSEEVTLDKRYDTLEARVILSIEDSLVEASLGEKVRALEVIHKRGQMRHHIKNPHLPAPGSVSITQNVVNLQLPTHAVKSLGPVIEMNEQSEIIAIEGRPLAPLSSSGVKNLFEQIAAKKQESAAVLEEL